MNISSIGMQSVPSYNGVKSNHTVAQQPEVAEIQQPTSDIFLSSLVNLTDKGLVECQDLPVSSSEKQTMKLSDEAVGELLGQIVAQCEEEKAPLSASNNTGAILMGEDEFQAASLGSLVLKALKISVYLR